MTTIIRPTGTILDDLNGATSVAGSGLGSPAQAALPATDLGALPIRFLGIHVWARSTSGSTAWRGGMTNGVNQWDYTPSAGGTNYTPLTSEFAWHRLEVVLAGDIAALDPHQQLAALADGTAEVWFAGEGGWEVAEAHLAIAQFDLAATSAGTPAGKVGWFR